MRIISLWQPYATLIVIGAKHFETRHWWTGYRGPLAIHAAQKKGPVLRDLFETDAYIGPALRAAGYGSFNDLPRGKVVGTCQLLNCHCTEDVMEKISEAEHAFGNFDYGRFAWELENPVKFAMPVPEIGRQGFWNWENNYVAGEAVSPGRLF